MDSYVTAAIIKKLREAKDLTQSQLAQMIDVSSKTISKWETGKGLPDVSILDSLASALEVSVMELMTGNLVVNRNISANMLRSKFYVCPVCGNIIHTMGEAVISCCGITLPVLEAEDSDESHKVNFERVEDEHYISIDHEMTKTHYISFVAYVSFDKINIVKLYPESNPECRFQLRGKGYLYYYCNRHGLMRITI